MTVEAWVTTAALLSGPLIGIWVTRLIDRSRESWDRKYRVFEALMRTRGLELTPEHVGAINMVPVVFPQANDGVLAAWERLMDALNDPQWESGEEEAKRKAMQCAAQRRATLVETIAKALRQPFPEKEEHRPGYVPKAWATDYQEALEGRTLLRQVLAGDRSLKMITAVVDVREQLPPTEQSEQGPTALSGGG